MVRSHETKMLEDIRYFSLVTREVVFIALMAVLHDLEVKAADI